ncbi:hypothetical protein PLICRDRAFT_40462 [Plicaturopsis crispa FD-325 SS-3]|nr:hypothetical protein PLICRDRAFT_40462 [Plicaturopsis crispa FD-325 SS-3]
MSSTISASASPSTTSPTPVPLAKFLPFLNQAAHSSFYLLRASFAVLPRLYGPLTTVVTWPLPILLYLLSPVFVLTHILYSTFIETPYNAIVGLAVALYPVYVFVGIAIVLGALVGVSGKIVIAGVSALILGPSVPEGPDGEKPPVTKTEKRGYVE